MRIRSQVALWTAIALVACASHVFAQRPQAASAPPASPGGGINIALIDISHVFKNHERFKQRTEEIKKEIKDFETRVNEQRKALNEKRTKMTTYNQNSPEYHKLEAEIAKEIANQNVEAELKRKEILEREAKVYHETYQEIVQAVTAFATRHNISLVLRFDGDEMDPNDRASVLRGVNRGVVYQDKINITYEILQMLNVPQTAARPAPAAAARRPAARTQ